jgi:hypothetical protein
MPPSQYDVSESALRIIEARRSCWPGELLCQVLTDEVNASSHLLSCPSVGTRRKVEPADIVQWWIGRVESLLRIGADYNTWTSSDFGGFFGRKGETSPVPAGAMAIQIPADAPSDSIPRIVSVARRLGAVYRQAIEWSHSVRNADVHPLFRELTYELSFYAESLLRAAEGFGPAILRMLDAHRDRTRGGAAAAPGDRLDLAPKLPDFEPLFEKFRELCGRLQSGVSDEDGFSVPGKAGYLYILTNPSLGSTVKVGKTKRSPRDRISELSAATAIPTPFALAFDAYVEDCDWAEAYVHARLEKDGYRVAKNREFFNVDVGTAIAVLLEAQAEARRGSGEISARR